MASVRRFVPRHLAPEIITLSREFPIVAVVGPRQSGKTTLVRHLFPDYTYVSFEDPDQRAFALQDPRGFLQTFPRRVIFDEIQRAPDLVSYLQTHSDLNLTNGDVVLTGSQNFLLTERISQSLAGRVGIATLLPFVFEELGVTDLPLDEVLFQGMYPRIYDQHIRPEVFAANYIATYVEKDVRQIRNITDLSTFHMFMKILAGRTGQELNLSAVADACGLSHNTVRDWISVLEASFLVHRVPPYHKNFNKRLVKNSKIYFVDTGLVCHLLGVTDGNGLKFHPLRGSIFETFVFSEFLKLRYHDQLDIDLFFWRDNNRNEIDLILESGRGAIPVEIKSAATVQDRFFKGLRYWKKISGESRTTGAVVYGGAQPQKRSDGQVIPWNGISSALRQLLTAG